MKPNKQEVKQYCPELGICQESFERFHFVVEDGTQDDEGRALGHIMPDPGVRLLLNDRKEIEKLRKALSFYAEISNWCGRPVGDDRPLCYDDQGHEAREALGWILEAT